MESMMRYICMGYHDEAAWQAMAESERKALTTESISYLEMLRRKGNCLDDTALQSPRSATTLRFDSGKVAVTDGPFAECKEQLGGFMVLEADDLNHAIALMSKLPCMRHGGALEIRPINHEITSR
jgi:hypothetical protein